MCFWELDFRVGHCVASDVKLTKSIWSKVRGYGLSVVIINKATGVMDARVERGEGQFSVMG